MESIKEAFLINGFVFSDLPKNQQEILENTFEKLRDWEQVILSFEKGTCINIATTSPSYTYLVNSTFAEDLSNTMLSAYIDSLEELNASQRHN